jgi:DNA-binding protein YbaB
VQQELESKEYKASAGGGAVTAAVSGRENWSLFILNRGSGS